MTKMSDTDAGTLLRNKCSGFCEAFASELPSISKIRNGIQDLDKKLLSETTHFEHVCGRFRKKWRIRCKFSFIGALREHFTACCVGKPMQNTENCKVEGELNNYIDSLLSNHTLLYSLSRFTACCIGKPIQNTENCKVEDELKNIMNIYFLNVLYFTVCPVFL